MKHILFLAANSARSKAYAQVFAAHGFEIGRTIIFDKEQASQPGKVTALSPPTGTCGLTLADPGIPLQKTCREISVELLHLEAENVNENVVLEAIRKAAADGFKAVVYSGYGGQLVGAELLNCGMPFLHAHSGWLPDYRGSTTVYYSLIDRDDCGVTVIALAPNIDLGPIIARRRFPAPSPGVDIDYYYDSAIRAELMAEVLQEFAEKGEFTMMAPQSEEEGHAYFVIHPVLKHLALLKLETRD
jgi:methionyl-tRNA formyltransferase